LFARARRRNILDVTIVNALPEGCEPMCRGCRHRALEQGASLEQKHAYLSRVLVRWLDRLAPLQPLPEDARLGYRDRVTLNARWSEREGWHFGLMRRDELIAIHACPVHSARVRGLIRLLRETLPPAAGFALGFLHVSGAQATLIVKQRHVDAQQLAATVAALPASGIEGLWVHCHPCAGRRLFARSGWTLVWGEAQSCDASGLWHGPTAFQQVLPALFERALARAEAHLAPRRGDGVLDLYCGHGSSLRRWVARGAATLGVDASAEAVRFAALNAPSASVLIGHCIQRLPQVQAWWTERAGTRTCCYLNPPRSGLEDGLRAAFGQWLRPEQLAYLSCSAGTLARDLQALESHGLRVEALLPWEFFPRTHHVEVLALLSRR
jgi:tRNA/tmRNA/rRNA uracil-C5-methylase (TrmA/RlmC/RlmD family)